MGNTNFSGVLGSATAAGDKVCSLMKWDFTGMVKVGKVVTNCSGGAHRSIIGAEDSNGTLEVAIEGDGARPLKYGDSVALVLDAGGPPGTTPGTNAITVDAVIKDMKIALDLASEQAVAWVYSWEGDGPAEFSGTLADGAANCCGVTPP
jgi:hypothetical protein